METKRTIAGCVCAAGLALSSGAVRAQAEPTPRMLEIIDSLTSLAEQAPADPIIRLKLAVVLTAAGMTEEAEWWRAEAFHLDPMLEITGMIDIGEDIPVDELMERGAGQSTTCFQHSADGLTPHNQPGDEPDVIVGSVTELHRWGRAASTEDGIFYTAYSVGTTSCNIGTLWLLWDDEATTHPVIGQNMYQWEPWDPADLTKGGRFQQIGASWLKHGFFALSQTLCCSPCSGTNGTRLGVGCSDPYGAMLNGSFGDLGPRSEVNAATGEFPWPHSSPVESTTLRGRVLVLDADLDQTIASNAASVYVAEGHYVTSDEPDYGHDNNNASYRRFAVSSSGNTHTIAFISGQGTQREAPAIMHWAEVEEGVTYDIVDFPGDGRVFVACNAKQQDADTWRYEYLVYNMNSDKGVGEFSVPVPEGVTVENVSFHDVHCHSGEPYSRTDWTFTTPNGSVKWAAEAVGVNANGNAIRWSTSYNFGFDADTPPQAVSTSLKPWKDGGFASGVSVDIVGPTAPICDLPNDLNADGVIDTADLGELLAVFGTSCRGVGPCSGDLNGDGVIDTADLGELLAHFGEECP